MKQTVLCLIFVVCLVSCVRAAEIETPKPVSNFLQGEDGFVYEGEGKKDPFQSSQPAWTPERTAMYLRESSLEGVVGNGDKSLAIVNGTVVKEGDTYLGSLVKKIEKDRAVFQVGPEEITVWVARSSQEGKTNEK